MPTGDPSGGLLGGLLGSFGGAGLGNVAGVFGNALGGVGGTINNPAPPLPNQFFGNLQQGVHPSVVVGAGEVAQESEEPLMLVDVAFRPSGLQDLVRSLPSDVIESATRALDGSVTELVKGKPIEPLPLELVWCQHMPLHTDKLYTMVKQIVQMELERFAKRIDLYYELTPRSPSPGH